MNGGKKSLYLDLKTSKGVELVRSLVWTVRNSSGISEGIYKPVVQSDR